MIDSAFRLLHAVSKPLLGKKLPKSKGSYSQYDDLLKGPNYAFICRQIDRGTKIGYQKKLRRSMSELVKFLGQTQLTSMATAIRSLAKRIFPPQPRKPRKVSIRGIQYAPVFDG